VSKLLEPADCRCPLLERACELLTSSGLVGESREVTKLALSRCGMDREGRASTSHRADASVKCSDSVRSLGLGPLQFCSDLRPNRS
jgi:hypothetical protein